MNSEFQRRSRDEKLSIMRVLICPLDWGMGHTARMIPVAVQLIGEGHHVTFGGSKRQIALIRSDLPQASTLHFPGFTTTYSRFFPMWFSTIFRAPALFISIIREHRSLKEILKAGIFDQVISDNRMGLWNKGVKTVYVTHMIRIPMPRLLKFLEPMGVLIHRLFINRFDECWIPDLPAEGNLSGRLSHDVRLPSNARYIGVLSKYSILNDSEGVMPESLTTILDGPWSVLILSGPEPGRGMLRKKITDTWSRRDELLVILEGNPAADSGITSNGSIISVPHLPPAAMAALIKGSREIISRSGYTTIMELASLGRLDNRATLIPTPGQTEQEYLAQSAGLRAQG